MSSKPFSDRCRSITVSALLAILIAVATMLVAPRHPAWPQTPPPPSSAVRNPAAGGRTASGRATIDHLLGRNGREKHAARLAARRQNGKAYPWEAYVRWGHELFLHSTVKSPPIGPRPSEPISGFYACKDCHNNRREDPLLTQQDPEARAGMIQRQPPAPQAAVAKYTLPALPIRLTPGTTLWGAVNRESFYNDSYAVYHTLPLENDREMVPTSLEDAIQTCCSYCSIGRLAVDWEIDSLLAYCWELELRLSDLDLPAAIERVVLKTLNEPANRDQAQAEAMREFLRRQYLVRAGDTVTAPPATDGGNTVGPYPDKLEFIGDAALGRRLYEFACDHCHGPEKPNERQGAQLVRSLKRFHGILSVGTERDDEPYMPRFTAQRLSRQQVVDIQTYLQSLQ